MGDRIAPASDTSDERLAELIRWTGQSGMPDVHALLLDLQQLRAAQATDADRVREVVREAAYAAICKLLGCGAGMDDGTSGARAVTAIAERVAAQLTPLDRRPLPSKADILATIKRVHGERTASQWFGSDAMQDAIADAIAEQLTASAEGDRPPGVTP
jgi:hypothetical protein